MGVTHETILVTLVRKEMRIAELEAALEATRAALAESQRDAAFARMERDNLLAIQTAGAGEPAKSGDE